MSGKSAGGDAWRPSFDISTARQRATMLAAARKFFEVRDVLEVELPSMSSRTVSDPNIESIRVSLGRDGGTCLYLQTSPEYFMKRLLCAGFPDIYSICKAFRESETGRQHQPEFTIVEWYRLGFGLQQMIDETCEFIEQMIRQRGRIRPKAVYEHSDLFREFAGIDPMRASYSALADACDADDRLRRIVGEDRDAWLDLLTTRKIAPRLPENRLTVIRHYPASQAALAQTCPENVSVADRFEVFLGGLELANGYVELRDGEQQLQRWQSDLISRQKKGLNAVPMDERLLEAMRHGLPACAGVATGFDRLVMLNTGIDHIARTQSFALEDL
jgi:lysyl-tRNA synthetase class 2